MAVVFGYYCFEPWQFWLMIFGAFFVGIILSSIASSCGGGRVEYIEREIDPMKNEPKLKKVNPVEIARKRYAKGEISVEEFETMIHNLENI